MNHHLQWTRDQWPQDQPDYPIQRTTGKPRPNPGLQAGQLRRAHIRGMTEAVLV